VVNKQQSTFKRHEARKAEVGPSAFCRIRPMTLEDEVEDHTHKHSKVKEPESERSSESLFGAIEESALLGNAKQDCISND